MPGMTNWLDLIATSTGTYDGSSANLSGAGFAGMTFTAQSSSQADFNSWVQSVKESPDQLDTDSYNSLAEPSTDNPASYYSSVAANLYDKIVDKDMMGASEISTSTDGVDMMGMEMSNGTSTMDMSSTTNTTVATGTTEMSNMSGMDMDGSMNMQ